MCLRFAAPRDSNGPKTFAPRRSATILESDSDSVSQTPQRVDPQKPLDGATNQLVAGFSRLYAEAGPEAQFALRVWMRDIILGRKERSVNMPQARRNEKRMVEACERRIPEFPLDMDEREVAKELRREGWYAWASDYVFPDKARAGKSGDLRNVGVRSQSVTSQFHPRPSPRHQALSAV
jgi:hypothetical protein